MRLVSPLHFRVPEPFFAMSMSTSVHAAPLALQCNKPSGQNLWSTAVVPTYLYAPVKPSFATGASSDISYEPKMLRLDMDAWCVNGTCEESSTARMGKGDMSLPMQGCNPVEDKKLDDHTDMVHFKVAGQRARNICIAVGCRHVHHLCASSRPPLYIPSS